MQSTLVLLVLCFFSYVLPISLCTWKKKEQSHLQKKRKKKRTKSPQDKPLLGKTVNQNAPSATQ